MQKKNKMLLKIASLSLLVLVQTDALARGRGNGANVYGEMITIEKNMAWEMRGQNLSNTYSGKLESNLAELDNSLRQAANLSGSGRSSKRGSVRGGNNVESDDEGLELLVKVSYEAIDVLKDLPAAAQENLQEAIQSADSDWDEALVDQAEEVLDELDDILGSDSSLRSNTAYRRTDNPARRRMFEQRHRSKKSKAQRNADRNHRKKNKGQKRSGKSGKTYGSSSFHGHHQPKQTRTDKREADDKRRQRALAKSAPAVHLGDWDKADYKDRNGHAGVLKALAGDFQEETRSFDRPANWTKAKADSAGTLTGGSSKLTQEEESVRSLL